MRPADLRRRIRAGEWTTPTTGVCPGSLQCNVVILERALADDFARFCDLNPAACPVVERMGPGRTQPALCDAESDIRTDVPRYRVYRDGVLVEDGAVDVLGRYNPDEMETFLIGCSFSFENRLVGAGIPVRNVEQRRNVSMFVTKRPCKPAGPFACPLVVSMRPIPSDMVPRITALTATSRGHGAPVHAGDPAALGIADLDRVDFGDAVSRLPGDVPVFWACGVTAITAAVSAQRGLVITHQPGHMLVTDEQD